MNEANEKLVKLLHELAEKHDIELPADELPDEDRRVYEDYIIRFGLAIENVDPVIDRGRLSDETSAQVQAMMMMALMKAESLPKNELTGILFAATQFFSGASATGLVNRLSRKLSLDLRDAGVHVPPFVPGVFPMPWFNAQCAIHDGRRIMLLANGCMTLLEVCGVLLLAGRKDARFAREKLAEAVNSYVTTGEVPEPDDKYARGLVDFGSGASAMLTTAAEEFCIAHEFGHLTLEHVGDGAQYTLAVPARADKGLLGRLRSGPPGKSPTLAAPEVVEKSRFQEHQADVWAQRVLLERAKRLSDDQAVPLAAAGTVIFLATAHLVEAAYAASGIEIQDRHPPAATRLYIAELLTELFGAHEEAYIARRFMELTKDAGSLLHGFEMPPMLDRDLNREVIPVLDSLGIDYSKAPFIADFT